MHWSGSLALGLTSAAFKTFSAMGVMTLLLGGKIFNAFVSCFVVHLSICRWLGEKNFL